MPASVIGQCRQSLLDHRCRRWAVSRQNVVCRAMTLPRSVSANRHWQHVTIAPNNVSVFRRFSRRLSGLPTSTRKFSSGAPPPNQSPKPCNQLPQSGTYSSPAFTSRAANRAHPGASSAQPPPRAPGLASSQPWPRRNRGLVALSDRDLAAILGVSATRISRPAKRLNPLLIAEALPVLNVTRLPSSFRFCDWRRDLFLGRRRRRRRRPTTLLGCALLSACQPLRKPHRQSQAGQYPQGQRQGATDDDDEQCNVVGALQLPRLGQRLVRSGRAIETLIRRFDSIGGQAQQLARRCYANRWAMTQLSHIRSTLFPTNANINPHLPDRASSHYNRRDWMSVRVGACTPHSILFRKWRNNQTRAV